MIDQIAQNANVTYCAYKMGYREGEAAMRRSVETALTALRRIRSLGEKNVPKYAQQIAKEALDLLDCNNT